MLTYDIMSTMANYIDFNVDDIMLSINELFGKNVYAANFTEYYL